MYRGTPPPLKKKHLGPDFVQLTTPFLFNAASGGEMDSILLPAHPQREHAVNIRPENSGNLFCTHRYRCIKMDALSVFSVQNKPDKQAKYTFETRLFFFVFVPRVCMFLFQPPLVLNVPSTERTAAELFLIFCAGLPLGTLSLFLFLLALGDGHVAFIRILVLTSLPHECPLRTPRG